MEPVIGQNERIQVPGLNGRLDGLDFKLECAYGLQGRF